MTIFFTSTAKWYIRVDCAFGMVTHEVLSDVARRVRVQPFALSKCAVVSLTQPQAEAGDDVLCTQQVHRMRQLMY